MEPSVQGTVAWMVVYLFGVVVTIIAVVMIVRSDEKGVRHFMVFLMTPAGLTFTLLGAIGLTKVSDANGTVLAIAAIVAAATTLGFVVARPPT